MQNNNFIKTGKNLKLALVAVLLAFVGVLATGTGNTRSYAAPAQAAGAGTAQSGELPSSTQAKRTLAEIDERSFANIKDARKRSAAQRSYNALKAVADNTSKAREAALIASFSRTVGNLRATPPPKQTFEQCDKQYETCIELCKETGGNCDLCRLGNEGCYLIKWAAFYAHENLP